MTKIAVNAWLKHWLACQQKSKCPLILKDLSKHSAATKDVPKDGSGKKHQSEWVELDEEEEEEEEDGENNTDTGVMPTSDNAGDVPEGSADSPDALATAAKSWTSCWKFLSTLSGDAKYQQLLLLMDSAKVSLLLFGPDWSLLMVT
jgi:hypothetical protein